jgi:hypothetical protein
VCTMATVETHARFIAQSICIRYEIGAETDGMHFRPLHFPAKLCAFKFVLRDFSSRHLEVESVCGPAIEWESMYSYGKHS